MSANLTGRPRGGRDSSKLPKGSFRRIAQTLGYRRRRVLARISCCRIQRIASGRGRLFNELAQPIVPAKTDHVARRHVAEKWILRTKPGCRLLLVASEIARHDVDQGCDLVHGDAFQLVLAQVEDRCLLRVWPCHAIYSAPWAAWYARPAMETNDGCSVPSLGMAP